MAPEQSNNDEIGFSRPLVLVALWRLIMNLRRNGNVIVFNHLKARIVWIGIVDVKATEEELIDLEGRDGGTS